MPRTTRPATPEVFAPAQLGPLTLRNRIIKAATFEGVMPGGKVSDALIEFHRRVAAGGAAMSTVAYLAVSPEGRTDRHCLLLDDETVHGPPPADRRHPRRGCGGGGPDRPRRAGRQRPLQPRPGSRPLRRLHPDGLRASTPSTRRASSASSTTTAPRPPAPWRQASTASRCTSATTTCLSAFLSPKLNKRKDQFGGSVENRARFARTVLRNVRDAVGDKVAVTAKLNMADGVDGGLWLDESVEVATLFEADGTLDALELTGGSSLANPMYLFRGDAPLPRVRRHAPATGAARLQTHRPPLPEELPL